MLKNTGFSYLGQLYVMLAGILIMPFYLKHMGAEAYGLIGFFTALQAWLYLLDAGLSPALARHIAHFRGMLADMSHTSGCLLRSFEILIFPVALFTGLAIYLGSGAIATHWLKAHELDPSVISHCISLMGLMIVLRLYATLYKSGIQGMEQHYWLNGINIGFATLRYFGAFLLITCFSSKPLHFFIYQTLVGLLEMLAFAARAYRLMPRPHIATGFDWQIVKPVLPFALGMSSSTVVWILQAQLDKVLLSKALTLQEYGYFSLVALVATGILSLTNPLVQILLPRLTMLTAEGRTCEMLKLYIHVSRLFCSVLFPVAGIIAFHGRELLQAWTGNAAAAAWSAPVLLWYALGSAFLAMSGFQFYLQYAYGQLRLHVWFGVCSAAISVPLMIYAALVHGALGTAWVWFTTSLVTLLVWPYVIHRRFAPGLNGVWLSNLIRIALATALGLVIADGLLPPLDGSHRLETFIGLAGRGAFCLFLVFLVSKIAARKPDILDKGAGL
jgi:O-antigen/teichoic acid export membrane protein